MAAAVCSAAPSPAASNTAFVISSTNRGMPSVRSIMSCLTLAGSGLLPETRSIIAAISRSPSRLSVSSGDVGPSNPRRLELRSIGDDQQAPRGLLFADPSATNSFETRWVDPMHVLENHQHRILTAPASPPAQRASSVFCLRCSEVNSKVG